MIAFLAFALAVVCGCNDYDDSHLWKGIDEAYNQLTEIEKQLDAISSQTTLLSNVVNGGAITSIEKNAEGGHTVRYKGSDNVEHTVVLAAKEDVVSADIIGVKEEGGVMYWTVTSGGKTSFLKDTDGSKIPVAGRSPSFGVDKEGYWTMNGNPILDASGSKIKSEGKTVSVIKAVEKDENGNAVITLGDGSKVTVPLFEAFSITLSVAGAEVIGKYVAEDASVPMTMDYVVGGKEAGQVILKLMRVESLEPVLNTSSSTIKITFGAGFEEGSFALMACDAAGDVIIRPVSIVAKNAVPDYYGIKTADDLRKFAEAVNTGANTNRFKDESGEVVLLQDVDMTGEKEWLPIGTPDSPFSGTFNGKGHSVTNMSLTSDVASYSAIGFFGALQEAVIENVTVGSKGNVWTLDGTCPANLAVGGIVGMADEKSKIIACTNNMTLDFEGNDPASTLMMIGGIVGQSLGAEIGGGNVSDGCVNNGDIIVKKIDNTGNGGTGMNVGGICAFAKSTGVTTIANCVNNGKVNAPSGRGGGICGTFENGTISYCVNNGAVEDDTYSQYAGAADQYNIKRMGGFVGGTKAAATIDNCTNNGNVTTFLGCRTGGFVGHNEGVVSNCTNKGCIIGNKTVDGSNIHGPGWACGYNKTTANLTQCKGYGHVGDLSFKNNPTEAPASMHINAVAHKNTSYDPEDNFVDWTLDAYFDWTLKETKSLAAGVTYYAYEFNNLPRKMKVVEVDLTSPNVDVTAAYADDIVPNPNANGNDNNGFCIRETLSQLCARKRTEGQNILAGINTGFFDSNDGISRGPHIQDGHPVYVNNEAVREGFVNHAWAFTVFGDGTASCGKKTFTGTLEIAGKSYEYFSVNDTIVRHGSTKYYANLYTSSYKKVPHSTNPTITNPLSVKALYIVAEYSGSEGLIVNGGSAEAVVKSIYDGRTTPLSEAPYLTADNQVAIQMTGTQAAEVATAVKAGDKIKITAQMVVDGETTKPISTQNSTMFQFLLDGVNNSDSSPAGHTNTTTYDPITMVAVDKAKTKVWFVEVDGRQKWVSMGLKAYEMARISQILGAWNMTRFDGGGSSAMWVYADGNGALVNTPSDSKGERSCLNYILIRTKKN